MTGKQATLDGWALERKYKRWIGTPVAQEIKAEVIKRARSLKAMGFTDYGIDGIWTAMRYDRAMELGPDVDGYRLNNNWRRFLSDEIMAECPDLDGFLTRRSSVGRPL